MGKFLFFGDCVSKQVLVDGKVFQPGPPSGYMQRLETMDKEEASMSIDGIACKTFFPEVAEFQSYDEFVSKQLMGRMNKTNGFPQFIKLQILCYFLS